jgi:chromosomal replication initiation ATPase DnaA
MQFGVFPKSSGPLAMKQAQAQRDEINSQRAALARFVAEQRSAVEAMHRAAEEAIQAAKRLEVAASRCRSVYPMVASDSSTSLPAAIINATASHFGVSTKDIKGDRRFPDVVLARHVAMFLMRAVTGLSTTSIARCIGRRDHTTILHGVRRISEMIAAGSPIAIDVAEIRARLDEAATEKECRRAEIG